MGVYYLGKDATFSFPGISNNNIKNVTINSETAAEADVTTRGSGNFQEFAFVRSNQTIEVTCLAHSTNLGAVGTVSIGYAGATGATGAAGASGTFQVMSISEPQDLDGAIEWTISLRKTASVAAATGATGATGA